MAWKARSRWALNFRTIARPAAGFRLRKYVKSVLILALSMVNEMARTTRTTQQQPPPTVIVAVTTDTCSLTTNGSFQPSGAFKNQTPRSRALALRPPVYRYMCKPVAAGPFAAPALGAAAVSTEQQTGRSWVPCMILSWVRKVFRGCKARKLRLQQKRRGLRIK